MADREPRRPNREPRRPNTAGDPGTESSRAAGDPGNPNTARRPSSAPHRPSPLRQDTTPAPVSRRSSLTTQQGSNPSSPNPGANGINHTNSRARSPSPSGTVTPASADLRVQALHQNLILQGFTHSPVTVHTPAMLGSPVDGLVPRLNNPGTRTSLPPPGRANTPANTPGRGRGRGLGRGGRPHTG